MRKPRMNAGLAAALFLSLICGCGAGDDEEPSLSVLLLEPHPGSSRIQDEISFAAVATGAGGIPVAPQASFQWEVRRAGDFGLVAAFQGRSLDRDIEPRGNYLVGLVVRDPSLGWGSTRAPFSVTRAEAWIQSPSAYATLSAGVPITIAFRGESDGGDVIQLVLAVVDLSTGSEAFYQVFTPSGSDTYSDSVSVSLAPGAYELRLTVTTTDPAEVGADVITITVAG